MSKKKKTYATKRKDEELQLYFHFKKRDFYVPAKKGKGSYNRKNFKKGVDNK